MSNAPLPRSYALRTTWRDGVALIDDATPTFAWRWAAGEAAATGRSVAVERRVGRDWRPLWIRTERSCSCPQAVYAGPLLESHAAYRWRVRAIGADGQEADWSDWARFDTGALTGEPWKARWIASPPVADQPNDHRARFFRGTLDLDCEVAHARASVSALGWYRLFVNGADVTGNMLVPRWTPFDHVVEYRAYDLTGLLRPGRNLIACAVADGRFRGMLGGHESRAVYGDRLAVFVDLDLTLASGERRSWGSDDRWMVGDGPIVASDPKGGERADLGPDRARWSDPADDLAGFLPAEILPASARTLIAESVPPVREVARLPAQRITKLPDGSQIVDFGQNLAGVVRLRLPAAPGATVALRHSELLDADGKLLTGYLMPPLKVTEQRDEVVAGQRQQWWQPWFTIHGFRYVAIEGLAEPLAIDAVEAVVLSSDLPASGGFACSDSVIEQLWRNVGWTLRSNMTDVFTDCPTRERAGWLADFQTTLPTAVGFVDCQAFVRRTLDNMRLEQFNDGRVPALSPAESSAFSGGPGGLVRFTAGSTGWGDAAVMLPWTLYRYYGDERAVADNYDMMRRWVDQLAGQARARTAWPRRLNGARETHILSTGFHFGEWLRPGEGFLGSMLRGWLTPDASIATAHWARSARLLATMAGVLGRAADAADYTVMADAVGEAWRGAFVSRNGRIAGDRQDDYVRALAFDLLLPEQRDAAMARLVALIAAAGDHLATGFLSTPLLLPTLSRGGHAALAFRLLQQRTTPSWRHQIERGATTIWETWAGYDRKGRGRLSHNHAAFGSVAQWLREDVAGLAPAAPGFRRIGIAPTIGGGLTAASAWMETPFGRAASGWRIDGDDVILNVTVPPGSVADVRFGDLSEECRPGSHRLRTRHRHRSD